MEEKKCCGIMDFFKKLAGKLDKKMKDKAQSSCCCKPSDKDKDSCCS